MNNQIVLYGNNYEINKNEYLNNNLYIKIFIWVQVAMCIILIFFIRETMGALKNLDGNVVRGLAFGGDGLFNKYTTIRYYIFKPILYGSVFLCTAGVFTGILKKRYLVLAMLNIFLYAGTILGRFPIFMAMVCIVAGVCLASNIRKIKIKLIHILVALLPIIAMISISVSRMSDTSALYRVFSSAVWYLTGPFTALDYFLKTQTPGVDFDYSLFRGVIGGFEELNYMFALKESYFLRPINHDLYDYIAVFRYLGPDAAYHNTFYTMIFTFIRDGGVFGVVFYSFMPWEYNFLFL